MKSVNLTFLKPSGPLQACDGTALSFITCSLSEISLRCFQTEREINYTTCGSLSRLEMHTKASQLQCDIYVYFFFVKFLLNFTSEFEGHFVFIIFSLFNKAGSGSD